MQGEERLINQTTSLCKTCKNAVSAQVVALPGGQVWMRKVCAQHGAQEVQLSNNAAWYEQTRAIAPTRVPPRAVKQPVDRGCPFDCGPCASHAQKIRLPVITITSACNLDCPICYVHNKNDGAFHMAVDDFKRVLGHLRDDHDGELDIVNFTGGEPTVHPHFLDFLELAHQAGIHRVTICSNGIRLAKDESLVRRLGELKARVALSFDSFEKDGDFELQGANLLSIKLRCLELLEKHDVDTTLIPVMTRGVNDHEVGRIIDLALGKRNIRHLEIHTMTFTGQSGVTFPRAGRISMFEVLERIEETTGGLLRPDDFVPSPCAHPLCYQIAYLLIDPEGGRPISFSRFMPRAEIYEALADRLYLEPTARLESAMRDAIDRLWLAADGDAEAARTLRLLKNLLGEMFPSGRSLSRREALRAGERAVKAVYVHSHMDEETFDTERAVECCDSNCYPDGTTIPVCNYNVLYREKEAHFNQQPLAWNDRSGGQKLFPNLAAAREGLAVRGAEAAVHRGRPIRLDGKRCLVTGGSRGLGLAIGEALARAGARVAFTFSKNRDDAEEARARIAAAAATTSNPGGGSTEPPAEPLVFQGSVADAAHVTRTVAEVHSRWGGVDILINNAGTTQILPIALLEEADWDAVMDVNVKGTYLFSRAVLKSMIRARAGQILAIGSFASERIIEAPVHYAAAKSALRGFTEALAREVGRYNIRVNLLSPGLFDAGMSRALPQHRLDEYLAQSALGRLGTVDEMARLALFLVSDDSSFMTGAKVVADGGL